MKSMTLTELDNLEREINKNRSANLRGLITSAEKVIVCLGDFKKASLLNWGDSITYFILTDYRLISNCLGFTNVMLDKIVNMENGWLVGLQIGLQENSAESVGAISHSKRGLNYYTVLMTTDADYVNKLIGLMNKYISESKIRLRSNTVNIKQDENDIAGQLEKLASLFKSGAITQSEYNKAKEKLLSE